MRILIATIAVLSSLLLAPAAGAVLYGLNGTAQLLMVDLATGVVTPIGTLGDEFSVAVGLARDPATGVFYAWVNGGTKGLVRVDPNTGAGTHVNPDELPGPSLGGLAFGPDGKLYSMNAAGTWEVDLVTGIPTLINTGWPSVIGLSSIPSTGEIIGVRGYGGLVRFMDPHTKSAEDILMHYPDGSLVGTVYAIADIRVPISWLRCGPTPGRRLASTRTTTS